MIKNKLLLLCFLTTLSFGFQANANPNFVTTVGAHYDSQGKLIPPDKYFLRLALKNYQDGFNQLSYQYFLKAAAFGNKVAQKYIGLMNIKALGVERSWPKGYAWLMLAADDNSQEHRGLKNQISKLLSPEEKQSANIEYEKIKLDYDDLAALKRRDTWVRKQKREITGSRVGAQTSNVYTYSANGRLISANGSAKFNEMTSFVEDYNFGYVEPGEIITVDNESEKETDKGEQ